MTSFVLCGIDSSVPKGGEVSKTHPDTLKVLKHSREILAAYCAENQVKLTVGDMSVASADKRRRQIELAVKKEAPSLKGLYIGRNLTPDAQTCESQEILKRMQQQHLTKAREIFEVKQEIFLNNAEEQARKESTEAILERRVKERELHG